MTKKKKGKNNQATLGKYYRYDDVPSTIVLCDQHLPSWTVLCRAEYHLCYSCSSQCKTEYLYWSLSTQFSGSFLTVNLLTVWFLNSVVPRCINDTLPVSVCQSILLASSFNYIGSLLGTDTMLHALSFFILLC